MTSIYNCNKLKLLQSSEVGKSSFLNFRMKSEKNVVSEVFKNRKTLFISSLIISQKSKKYEKAGFILKFL